MMGLGQAKFLSHRKPPSVYELASRDGKLAAATTGDNSSSSTSREAGGGSAGEIETLKPRCA